MYHQQLNHYQPKMTFTVYVSVYSINIFFPTKIYCLSNITFSSLYLFYLKEPTVYHAFLLVQLVQMVVLMLHPTCTYPCALMLQNRARILNGAVGVVSKTLPWGVDSRSWSLDQKKTCSPASLQKLQLHACASAHTATPPMKGWVKCAH